MSTLIVGSNMKDDPDLDGDNDAPGKSYGQNGDSTPASVPLGSVSAEFGEDMAATVPSDSWQTRSVSAEHLPLAMGHKPSTIDPATIPDNGRPVFKRQPA